jgi:hypothetical protein
MEETWSIKISLGNATYSGIKTSTKEEAVLKAIEMLCGNPCDALPNRCDVNSGGIEAYAYDPMYPFSGELR